jgi:hypothetical protein
MVLTSKDGNYLNTLRFRFIKEDGGTNSCILKRLKVTL